MALHQSQQFLEAVKRSQHPLICVPAQGGPDGYATALGLARVLRRLEKNPVIVATDGLPAKNLHFLEDHQHISPVLENLQKFTIELDASQTRVDELSYEIKDDRLYVYLSPKKGAWQEKDIKLSTSDYRYDLIITVAAQDLEILGRHFHENPDFFFTTPIINLDHNPANEHYGQINVVDLTASACGEVAHDLIAAIEPELIDAQVATAFLTGMVAKTKSFKSKNVTPKTLMTASRLIARGAERAIIVDNLYRTRSVATLRLWGRTLARLKVNEEAKLVWSLLSQQDFMHAGGEEDDLVDVIDELIASSPEAKIVALIYEDRDQNICAIIRAENPLDAVSLTSNFRPSGTREEARLCFTKSGKAGSGSAGKTIVQVEKELIKHLTEQGKKLGL
ncbi:DHH family phosphoesterase [Patescibacteria group bacterium]|nr:DHH family phosphoesterase [Patescibacteria group bacterium]